MRLRTDIRDYVALAEADRAAIAQAQRFAAEHVAPTAAEWERSRQAGLPAEVVRAWVGSGLVNALVAADKGGGGASYLGKIGMVEVLAAHCLPSSFALCNLQNGPNRILRDGTPDQIARWLPGLMSGEWRISPGLTEPQSGSDFAAMRTRARRTDGGWVLDGEKAWITNAAIANVCAVYAQTDETKKAGGIGCFLVKLNTGGATVSAPYRVETGSVIGAASIHMRDCFVADADVLQAPGTAFGKALASINGARTYVAAMCCGMVGEALELAVAYGRERRTFGKPIIEHQGLRWMLADAATDLEAARLLTYRAAELIARGEDAVGAAAYAKKHAVEMAVRRLPDCLQAMGANGLRSEVPIARHILATRIAGFVDGSTEIQTDRIGRLAVDAAARAD